MLARRSLPRRYTLVFLRKGPADRSEEARNEQLQLEHLQHLTKLQVLETAFKAQQRELDTSGE